tara:strand:+ start:460 stop:726 length:267 start_codon:yes stop_codon:yes gene_type:complete
MGNEFKTQKVKKIKEEKKYDKKAFRKWKRGQKLVYDEVTGKTTTRKEYKDSGHKKQVFKGNLRDALLNFGGVSALLYGGTRGSSHDKR